jgi:diaminohydroxyphosphoribosylaminopyrimidine deaminase / 5-amino-6-(5-phosphoribosylamino)uracil reductase
MSDKEKYMRRALQLAAKGLGRTGTNPVVGAVVVKNGRIIGSGYHKKRGGDHAEVAALRGIEGKQAKGATMYVTLEPCVRNNAKLTPPCADLLANSGLESIEIAVRDPNPLVNGKGVDFLVKAGLKVHIGLLEKEAEETNEFYFKSVKTSLPFVTLKLALSLDGRIATSTGDSRWISCPEARKYVHEMRDEYCAVLTTSATVLADDPHLGVRLIKGRDPLRVIIDRKARLGGSEQVFRDNNHLLVKSEGANDSIREIFKDLYKRGIGSILVEAGATFAAALIREKLVDRCNFFIAPKIIGGDGVPAIGGLDVKRLSDCFLLKEVVYNIVGDNIFITGKM